MGPGSNGRFRTLDFKITNEVFFLERKREGEKERERESEKERVRETERVRKKE